MTIRHIVLIKFKEDTDETAKDGFVKAYDAVNKKLDIILKYERGIQLSKEPWDGGFTHFFQLEFEDERTRSQFLAHDEHEKLAKLLVPIAEHIVAVHYVNQLQR